MSTDYPDNIKKAPIHLYDEPLRDKVMDSRVTTSFLYKKVFLFILNFKDLPFIYFPYKDVAVRAGSYNIWHLAFSIENLHSLQ
jgi:hypothetical protein